MRNILAMVTHQGYGHWFEEWKSVGSHNLEGKGRKLLEASPEHVQTSSGHGSLLLVDVVRHWRGPDAKWAARYLLQHGVGVDDLDADGHTPLWHAVGLERLDAAIVLLEYGGSPVTSLSTLDGPTLDKFGKPEHTRLGAHKSTHIHDNRH